MVRQEDAVLVLFQDEGSGAALQLVREYLDDAAIVHLVQGFFSHPLHGFVDTEGSDTICCVKNQDLLGSDQRSRLLAARPPV